MKFSKHIDGAALPTWDWCGLRHWAELSLVVGSVLRVPRWVVSVACGSISFCVCRGKAATATLTATRDYELLQKLSTFQKASVLATFTCILWSHESSWLLDITWYYLMLLDVTWFCIRAKESHRPTSEVARQEMGKEMGRAGEVSEVWMWHFHTICNHNFWHFFQSAQFKEAPAPPIHVAPGS